MPRVGYDVTITEFERAKRIDVFESAATALGYSFKFRV
jgi:hypothetical protein